MPDPGPDPFPRATDPRAADESGRFGYSRSHPARPPEQPRRNIRPWLVSGVLLCFLIGLLASPWLEGRVRSYLPEAVRPPISTAQTAEVQALEGRLAQLEAKSQALAAHPNADVPAAERIAALEAASTARLKAETGLSAQMQGLASDLDRVSEQAMAGDERMRDLFLLSVMRRMVDAGRPLTPIEELVATRFRTRDGAAVDALAEWSRQPQTRRTLAARLPELGRVAAQADAQAAGNWWDRVKASLSSLVTVRQAPGEQTPGSMEVVESATAALKAGDLDLAISQMASGPQNAATRQWIRDASLLLAADVAMDRLDTLALTAAIPAVQPAPAAPTQAPLNAR